MSHQLPAMGMYGALQALLSSMHLNVIDTLWPAGISI
jgi:hypothetical protein